MVKFNTVLIALAPTMPSASFPISIAIQQLRLTNMFSFLRLWAFRSSEPPPPPPLKGDLTVGPSDNASDTASDTASDHHHNLYRADPDQLPLEIFELTPVDMPDLFDILLSDIDAKALRDEISTALGSEYMSKTAHLTSPHTTVKGIVFGMHHRVLFPLVVRFPRKSCSYVIHFLYDSGGPHTFLSKEVCGVPKHFNCSH